MAIVFKVKPWYKKGAKAVSFSDGTDAEIAAILQAYYNNELTWEEMGWQVGDTRLIHLNAMQAPNPNSSSTWAAQDITIVIVAHDHTVLASAINGHTKACITVQTRECLNNNTYAFGQDGHIYVQGTSSKDTAFYSWADLYMRTYLNATLLDSISYSTGKGSGTSFKDIIKQSKHYIHVSYNGSGVQQVTDTLFLPSYPEIYGTQSYNQYVATSPVEGTQFEYYKETSNRIKYCNDNGEPNSTNQYWWHGSPSSGYSVGNGYRWGCVDTGGNPDSLIGTNSLALAPAWAM